MLGDLLNLFDAIGTMSGQDYDERKVARNEVAGVTVSTVYTSDYGYETAICDEKSAHPVQRYGQDKLAAEDGHHIWIRKVADRDLKTIHKLGYGSLVDDEEYTLVRAAD